MRRFATVCLFTLVTASLIFARSTNLGLEPAEVVDMQQTIFTAGGLLEIRDSFGDVQIVGWDQPEIEVVVTKSTERLYGPEEMEKATAELDRIVVNTRQLADDHVVIRTEFPSRSLLKGLGGRSKVHLSYRIHVPHQTRLIVHQDQGELRIHDVRASMYLNNRQGDIVLNLPETEKYAVDAKARIGGVNSEWCSSAYKSSTDDGIVPHRLQLRVGVGDITVRKSHVETETLVD